MGGFMSALAIATPFLVLLNCVMLYSLVQKSRRFERALARFEDRGRLKLDRDTMEALTSCVRQDRRGQGRRRSVVNAETSTDLEGGRCPPYEYWRRHGDTTKAWLIKGTVILVMAVVCGGIAGCCSRCSFTGSFLRRGGRISIYRIRAKMNCVSGALLRSERSRGCVVVQSGQGYGVVAGPAWPRACCGQ